MAGADLDAAPVPTPVTVIGGYLGAGKTTLLNACLKTRGNRRIAVLVNDFGDINIDAALIESQTDTVLNLAGGCVCCTIGSDFMEALFNLAELSPAGEPRFDHVLVETSGVALPKPLAQSIGLCASFQVESILVLADACETLARLRDPYMADTVRQQLDQADWILVTKSQEPGAAPLDEMRRLMPDKPVFALAQQDYDCDWLLGAGRAGQAGQAEKAAKAMSLALDKDAGPAWDQDAAGEVSGNNRLGLSGKLAPPKPSASAAFDSLSVKLGAPVDLPRLEACLTTWAAASPGLVRAKGFVRAMGGAPGQQLLQLVGKRLKLEPSGLDGPDALVLIGLKGAFAAGQPGMVELQASLGLSNPLNPLA